MPRLRGMYVYFIFQSGGQKWTTESGPSDNFINHLLMYKKG